MSSRCHVNFSLTRCPKKTSHACDWGTWWPMLGRISSTFAPCQALWNSAQLEWLWWCLPASILQIPRITLGVPRDVTVFCLQVIGQGGWSDGSLFTWGGGGLHGYLFYGCFMVCCAWLLHSGFGWHAVHGPCRTDRFERWSSWSAVFLGSFRYLTTRTCLGLYVIFPMVESPSRE